MIERIAAALVAIGAAIATPALAQPIERVKLPPGFSIEIFAKDLEDARSMALGEKGTLFVGTRGDGRVYAIRHDAHKALQVYTIAKGLRSPNGVAVRDGSLYVAEVSKVQRFDAIESSLEKPPAPVVVYDKLPSDRSHGWKYLRFGPDGWLYMNVGAPCNICEPAPPYASIVRIKPASAGSETTAMEVFAKGVRNSVGFDWDPRTKELWFTDNGRDMMGDDVPPDELNHAPRAGMHFGYPYCHGGDIPDPEFGRKHPCSEFEKPAQRFGAHVASLGMRFYTGSMFPPEYQNVIFIAEHGSWNRSKKSGYRVMTAKVVDGKVVEHKVFAEGFLDAASDRNWGRPVDILQLPDGSLLVSDDYANAIYRISYVKP